MAKKITVTLSDKAEQYLAEVMYGLTDENDKPASQSLSISESLETLALFEKATDNQLRNWLDDFNKLTGTTKEFAANPTPPSEHLSEVEIKPAEEILENHYNKNLGFLSIEWEQVLSAMEAYASQFKSSPAPDAKDGEIKKLKDIIKQMTADFAEKLQLMNNKPTEKTASQIFDKPTEAWIEAVKDDGVPLTEGSYYYPLFKFFNDEHNLILLDADIQEILHQVEKFKQGK